VDTNRRTRKKRTSIRPIFGVCAFIVSLFEFRPRTAMLTRRDRVVFLLFENGYPIRARSRYDINVVSGRGGQKQSEIIVAAFSGIVRTVRTVSVTRERYITPARVDSVHTLMTN